MSCPYCSSNNIVKAGHLKSRAQRYICRNCGKRYSDVTVIKPKVTTTCPVCSSTRTVKCGKTKNGQRYLCRECGKRFSILRVLPESPKGKEYDNITCPVCGHNHFHKRGFTSSGEQYYRCTACGKIFSLKSHYRHLSEKEKQLITMYALNLKVPRKDIAKSWNISDKTVYNVIRAYKERLNK